jgi:hypothetical protein
MYLSGGEEGEGKERKKVKRKEEAKRNKNKLRIYKQERDELGRRRKSRKENCTNIQKEEDKSIE